MSLKERNNAVDLINEVLCKVYGAATQKRAVASHILNKLLRAGYLNDKTRVTSEDIKEELEKAPFKCKVQE